MPNPVIIISLIFSLVRFLFGNEQMSLVDDPVKELSFAVKAIIKQKIEFVEILAGCETPNRYHVYLINNDMNKKYLFKCKEESSWCDRNCCSGDNKPFRLKVKHVDSLAHSNEDYTTPFAEFIRPFKYTYCCLERPEMTGYKQSDGSLFGKLTEPCTCCDPVFNVLDQRNRRKWRISCNCCQCGFCWRNGGGKCAEVIFNIYPEDMTEEKGQCSGIIRKKFAGFQGFISDADIFELIFPLEATPEDKFMLIGAALLIDYRYYEDDSNHDHIDI